MFGEGVAPSLNLTAGAAGAGFMVVMDSGNAFALALDDDPYALAALNVAVGDVEVVSVE